MLPPKVSNLEDFWVYYRDYVITWKDRDKCNSLHEAMTLFTKAIDFIIDLHKWDCQKFGNTKALSIFQENYQKLLKFRKNENGILPIPNAHLEHALDANNIPDNLRGYIFDERSSGYFEDYKSKPNIPDPPGVLQGSLPGQKVIYKPGKYIPFDKAEECLIASITKYHNNAPTIEAFPDNKIGSHQINKKKLLDEYYATGKTIEEQKAILEHLLRPSINPCEERQKSLIARIQELEKERDILVKELENLKQDPNAKWYKSRKLKHVTTGFEWQVNLFGVERIERDEK